MADSACRQIIEGRTVRTRTKFVRWDVREAKMQKELQKKLREDILRDAVKMYIDAEARSENNNQVPHKTIPIIMNKLGNPPWLTRDHIYNAVRKFRRQVLLQSTSNTTNETQLPPPVSEITISPNSSRTFSLTSSLSLQSLSAQEESEETNGDNEENLPPAEGTSTNSTSTSKRNKGGRPTGLTKKEIETRKKKLDEATEVASNILSERRKRACIDGLDRLAKGTKDKILEEAVVKVGLPKEESKNVNYETVRSRVRRNNNKGFKGSYIHVSPMASVEPALVEICMQLNRMGMSLTPSDFLLLANGLIEGQDVKEEVVKYKQIVCGVVPGESEELGRRYFHQFMKRHSDVLSTTRPKKTDLKRREWATYDNMSKMYTLCYDVMVEAGVATKLPEEVCFDRNGNIVDSESNEKYGLPSSFQVTHPDYILFVDETGSSTNMKKDKARGGSRVISEKGFQGGKDCIATDITYTTMGFTAATGEPVMCVVIFKSESKTGIRDSWVNGLDITKLDETLAHLEGENFINAIKNNGQACGGGPKCFFRGKNVPCLVQHSPHGGVNGEILTNCLRMMDHLDLFPRTDTLKPFLLLDGHDSRFALEFLEYIRNPIHSWCCCFGVPYGTHFWQVGDSKQQNKSFKENESKFKEILMAEKRKKGLKMVFKPTDIIPIVNYSRERSFARVDCNKKAILERGWNPCNFMLLTDSAILRTKVSEQEPTDETTPATQEQQTQVQVPNLNTNTGMAATILDALFEQRDLDLYKRRKMEREQAQQTTAKILDTTKQLTSGTVWNSGINGLHSDAIWDCKVVKIKEKEKKECDTKMKKKGEFIKRKQTADAIRLRDSATWKVSEILHLLTYKRINGDVTIKSIVDANKGNSREALLREWEKRKVRVTPPCSPIVAAAEMNFFGGSDINDDEVGENQSV